MALLENGYQSRFILAQGTLTLNGTASVSVALTTIERTSVVVLSLNTVGATPNVGMPWVNTITIGTGFTVRGITASADDIYNYVVFSQP